MPGSHSSEERPLDGFLLNWQTWEAPDPATGAVFFIHGHGDFSDRYQEIAHLFTSRGFTFVTCDLPGHGRSPGKRGHIPSLTLIDKLTNQGLSEAKKRPGTGLLGLCGHSVGGLLALHTLRTTPQPIDFAWLSSPLIDPESTQATWKRVLLRPFSGFLPSLTVSTGVTAKMCREYLPGETATQPLQFHNRISLSWGKTLIDIAAANRNQLDQYPKDLPVLFTQGGKDPICLPNLCRDFVENLPLPNKQFKFFPDSRHEPFADQEREMVFQTLRDWLASLSPVETSRDT